MFVNYIFFVHLVTVIDGLFVSVGNYSHYTKFGLNVAECGLEYVPIELDVSFGTKCFHENYPNKTIKVLGRTSDLGSIPIYSRIRNGREASSGEAPWHVYLRINGKYICGGSLITLEWVLTAAHCLDSLNSGYAYAGSHQRSGGTTLPLDPNRVIQHRFYLDPGSANSSLDHESIESIHDIGMVKLIGKFDRKLVNGHKYLTNTICLPEENQINVNNESATFTGYGDINENNDRPHVLQIATIDLAQHNLCYYPGMLCAFPGYNQTKGCAGDSGGPLFQYDRNDVFRAIIVGVYHGGTIVESCTIQSEIDYWSAPSKFIQWILNNIESNQ